MKDKIIAVIDQECHAFSEIAKILQDKLEIMFMWPGYFRENNIFHILGGLTCYRFKGYRIIHFQWLHICYLKGSLLRSVINSLKLLTGLVFAKLVGFKVIWTCHNIFPHKNPYPRLVKMVRKLFSKMCNYILVLHEDMASNVRENYSYGGPIKCVNLGDYRKLYPGEEATRSKAKEWFNLEGDPFTVVNIGGIRRYKNLKVLIKAFLEFKHKINENSKLIIGGKVFDESYAKELRSISSEKNITSSGFITLLPILL